MAELLAELTRGDFVESRHYGDIAVTDHQGKVIWSLGDPARFTYMRSAAKPLQALPLCESGADDGLGLTGQELAVMVGSHSAEREHLDAVASVLEKAGCSQDNLSCGPHSPIDPDMSRCLARMGKEPEPLHNNCSGQHAGLLALCRYLGLGSVDYRKPEHPVQSMIMEAVSSMVSFPLESMGLGVDGCGLPVFAMPLKNMAWAYARMVRPAELTQKRARAIGRIRDAMIQNPRLVAGKSRLCTDLITAGAGDLVAKSGAEGIYCVGSREKGFGVALKIDDGSSRAVGVVITRVLIHLGVMGKGAFEEAYGLLTVRNTLGEIVGDIRPSF